MSDTPTTCRGLAAPTSASTSEAELKDAELLVKANRGIRRAAARTGVDLSGEGYLRLRQVLELYPVSRAAWYEGMSRGIYPASVSLSKRTVGWSRESIRNLIANPPAFGHSD